MHRLVRYQRQWHLNPVRIIHRIAITEQNALAGSIEYRADRIEVRREGKDLVHGATPFLDLAAGFGAAFATFISCSR